MSKDKEKFLEILHRYMDIHGTVYYETQRPPEVPAFVKNHGLLPQQELQQLLRKAKVKSVKILTCLHVQFPCRSFAFTVTDLDMNSIVNSLVIFVPIFLESSSLDLAFPMKALLLWRQ